MDALEQRLAQADRLSTACEKIGFALWQLQELEGACAQYLVLLTQAKPGMGLEVGSKLEEAAKSKTFGTTVKLLSEAGLLEDGIERRFRSLLSERNWLVHRSRADGRKAIATGARFQELISRAETVADESLKLIHAVGDATERFAKERGVSEEYIAKMAAKILNQWHSENGI